jgi:hypothetical protein
MKEFSWEQKYAARCDRCGFHGPIKDSKVAAVEAANRRAPPERPKEDGDLKALLEATQYREKRWRDLCSPLLEYGQKHSKDLGIKLGESIFAHAIAMMKEKVDRATPVAGSEPGTGSLTAADRSGPDSPEIVAECGNQHKNAPDRAAPIRPSTTTEPGAAPGDGEAGNLEAETAAIMAGSAFDAWVHRAKVAEAAFNRLNIELQDAWGALVSLPIEGETLKDGITARLRPAPKQAGRECWVWYGDAGHPEQILDRKPKEWTDPHWVRMVESPQDAGECGGLVPGEGGKV